MSKVSYSTARDIFLRVVGLPPTTRGEALRAECGGHAALEALVRSMLDADETPESAAPWGRVQAVIGSNLGAAAAWIPDQVGPYRVLRRIGAGGMGEVYEAEETHPPRRVALKVMAQGLGSDDARRRFEQECRILARLDHPGIAVLYAAGSCETPTGARPWFAMRLVSGMSLAERAKSAPYAPRSAADLIRRTAQAVEHAHRRGVIHRDLKPANVMVSKEGHPVVLDFGIARMFDPDSTGETQRTELGVVLGTLNYMSPEQGAGDSRAVDGRTDVYALGAILYELLVGQPVHDLRGLSPLAAIDRLRRPPRGPRSLNPALEPDLESIVLKALALEPRDRYATPADLAEDLQRFLDHRAVVARPAGVFDGLRNFRRRNPLAAAMVVALAVLAIGAAAWIVRQNWKLQSSNTRVEAERRRVSESLDRITRLADLRRHEQLVAEAEALHPAYAAQIPALESWLDRATELAARLPLHRTTLASLGTHRGDPSATISPEAVWEQDLLRTLITRLEAFSEGSGAKVEEVRRSLEFAKASRARSLEAPAAEWKAAEDRVAVDPRFVGLRWMPIEGLIPLGPDPASGFEEFLDLRSHAGPIPVRNDDGDLRLLSTVGVIYVLLPGGKFWMGAQSEDRLEPRLDPRSGAFEGPPHEVEVPAFLIGKFEVTQGQWLRIMGQNPSSTPAGSRAGGRVVTELHPVEQIGWSEAAGFCRRIGGALPSEAQWEYAARGGTTTPWFAGTGPLDLQPFANIADEASKSNWAPGWPAERGYADGFPDKAPVGSLRPNPFGLHDVAGNVFEWVLEPSYRYEQLPNLPSIDSVPSRLARGGSFSDPAAAARSACRAQIPKHQTSGFLGLRVVREWAP